jgi:dihydroflavonol-4-reductase
VIDQMATQTCIMGATGFIGGAIARAAVERGWRARAVRRRPKAGGALGDISDRVQWVDGAIEDHDRLVEAMSGCDLVFHPAGYYTSRHAPLAQHLAAAVLQIRQVLGAFEQSGAGRLVYTSSLTTIGPPSRPDRLADESDPFQPGSEPKSPYYECKAAMEAEVLTAATRGVEAVVCNPTMTFGPGDVKAFTGRLLIMAHRGWLLASLPGTLNFVDVREVAVGHLEAGEHLPRGERVILGAHNLPVPEAFRLITAAAGRRPPLFTVPRQLVETTGWLLSKLPIFALQDHMTTLHCWKALNTAKGETLLGIRPRPFAETIEDALAWYRKHGYLK